MKGKIIVPLLLASLGAGVVATTKQQYNVYADVQDITSVIGRSIEVTGFKNSGKLGEQISLPTVNDADLVVKLVDPTGKEVSIEGNSFTPKLKGYYTLTYSTKATSGEIVTTTNPLRIFVSGEDYSVILPTNSKYVIPSTIPTSLTNALKISAPVVKLGDKEIDAFEDGGQGLQVYVINKDGSGSEQALEVLTD